jgi:hypothetical protein
VVRWLGAGQEVATGKPGNRLETRVKFRPKAYRWPQAVNTVLIEFTGPAAEPWMDAATGEPTTLVQLCRIQPAPAA